MKIGDIIEGRAGDVLTISDQDTLVDAAETMADLKIGLLVVFDVQNGTVGGVISERDLVRALADKGPDAATALVADFMTRDVMPCSSDDSIMSVLKVMKDGGFRHMPVVDDSDIKGVVTAVELFASIISRAEKASG